jgi:hypothetical protein
MLTIVRFLHVLSMASWLGASLWLAGDTRRSLAAGPDAARAFFPRALAALSVDRWAGVATFVTGAGLLHLAHLWPPPLSLAVGMVLAVARAGLTDAALFPAFRKLSARLAAGESTEALLPVAGRVAMLSGIGHVIWLGALAGMIAAT